MHANDSQLWDDRYNTDKFIYGEEPNFYFRQEIQKLTAGRMLLPGDGEGRNGIFAAKNGWEVDCFDWSSKAKDKALAFAKSQNVSINYTVADIIETDYIPGSYDCVALIFIHLDLEIRKAFHKKIMSALKPGGTLIQLVYSKEQAKRDTGGPRTSNLLYSLEEVIEENIDMDFNTLSAETLELNEGNLHRGVSDVIMFTGVKKEE